MANFKEEYENFVFYGSWKTLLSGFDKETAKEILWEIVNIGVGEEIESDNPMIIAIIQGAVMPNIKSAKNRYAAAIENGKKGGRPKVDLNEQEVLAKKKELGTWKATAQYFGVDEDTLRKQRKTWEKAEKPKNPNPNPNITIMEKAEKPKNHDKDKDKDIDIDIDIDIDKDIEKENIGDFVASQQNPATPLASQVGSVSQETEQVEAVGADKVITINCSDMRDSYYHLYKYLAKYQPALASFVANSLSFGSSNKEKTAKAIEICNTCGYTINFNDTAAARKIDLDNEKENEKEKARI